MNWIPIKYAPTDGTYVMVWAVGAHHPGVARFCTIDGKTGWAEEEDETIPKWEVTHWAFIPKGPQS